MRYIAPLIFFGAAAFVWNYNQTHTDSYLLFPFLGLIEGWEGDFETQAEWSWRIVAGIGGVLLVWAILSDVAKLFRKKEKPKAE